MRTAAICPTCATYTNSVCVIYDGPYLSNLGINPMSSLDDVLQQINFVAGTFEKTANKSTNTSLGTSNILYPTQNAVKTYVDTEIAAIPVPSLQQVTDVSNSTTLPLYSKNVGDTARASIQVDSISGKPFVGLEDNNSNEFSSLSSDALSFTNGSFINSVSVKATNITSPSKVIELPNESGTFVLSVNGNAADISGNVALPVFNLQQVTDAGNQTSTGIIVADGGNVNTAEIFPGTLKAYYDPSGEFVQIDKNTITFNNGSFDLDVVNPTLTAARTINLPNASGTVALSVNGNAADASGNITISGTTYLVYTALISTGGGAISSVVVLENTLGQTITWTVPSNGRLRATSTGTPFTVGKTWMTSGGFNNASSPMIVTSAQGNLFPTSTIDYDFFLHDGTQNFTPNIDKYSVEIRVYP